MVGLVFMTINLALDLVRKETFFTTNGKTVWKHYSDNVDRGNFYGD